MSLFTKLFEAVHSWRRRRGGIKPRKRADLAMEQLDHRQLLAVNFTGVAANDFPAIPGNGVTVVSVPSIANGGRNVVPIIPPQYQGLISVSGLQINDYRVLYDPTDDTLNVGLEGPPNGRDGRQVIAGDSDNNGNSATVDPRVLAVEPNFQDIADMGGSKQYGIFLDLKNPLVPDVVAGFPNPIDGTTFVTKPYQVAAALNTGAPAADGTPAAPSFNEQSVFPQYSGNYYLANDPNHPNFELTISHFSQLYQQITGNAFTGNAPLSIGAFGQSSQDPGINDEFFPPQALTRAQITPPTPVIPPPPVAPVCSPTIFVNPHQNYHINSAHPSPVRVSVLGSSGFDPTTIIPSSVRFGNPATIATTGASPILNFENNVNRDQFADETFVFNGVDVNLPAGITQAEITGTTTTGINFASTVQVFNRDVSYYTQAQINKQQATWAAYDKAHGIDTTNGLVPPPVVIPKAAQQRATSAAINDLYNPFQGEKVPRQVNLGTAAPASVSAATFDPVAAPTTTVKIRSKAGKPHKGHATPTVTTDPSPSTSPTVSIPGVSPSSTNLAGAN